MKEQEWLNTYRTTVYPLFNYVAKRTRGHRELAEDIVQETYLRALKDWQKKSLPDSPQAWLNRVARNILIDYLRKKKRENRDNIERFSDVSTHLAENKQNSLDMFLAISSLGQKKAKVIEAHYYDGKSLKAIAAEMAISYRAVEGYLRRARQSLKSLLPNHNSNGGEK